MKYILASASPRRLELLRQIGIKPLVSPSNFSEKAKGKNPREVVKHNAQGKAEDILKKYSSNDVIIGADTIVVLEGKILGKPKNAQDAKAMLKKLSGKTHEVLTGVAVLYKGKKALVVEKTKVEFRELSAKEIADYVLTKEPLDKAGAYGIQGKGAILVKKINGCYSNVVGLPLTRIYELFQKLEIVSK